MNAWIESADGARTAIESNCYFGRSHVNTVQLQSPGASRRHALIHCQQADSDKEYWLADLGSTNGTLCNARRVTLPVNLKEGDVIGILAENFTFHRLNPGNASRGDILDTQTADTVKIHAKIRCWFVMLDIKSYTTLSCQLDENALGLKVGQWLRQIRDITENAGGVVDKFLGDAVFVYWKMEAGNELRLIKAINY